MKKPPKTKPKPRKARITKSKKTSVSLVCDSSLLRHLRLVEHRHTVKLIHHRHTSHFSLIFILLVLGLFLFAGDNPISAVTSTRDVQINVVVTGPAPTVGAIITTPLNGDSFVDKTNLNISGTCPVDTFVVVKNNDILAGSTNCTTAGIFDIDIQLYMGPNVIVAQNYDNYNQAGPATNVITINSSKTNQETGVVESPAVIPPIETPIIPDNPSVIPGKDDNANCERYDYGSLPEGDNPYVSIVCMPRLFNANIQQYMGVLVWSGVAPYAVSVDLGDDNDPILRSFASNGYYRVAFAYKKSGKYDITVKLTDQINQTSIVQSAVQVNGQADEPEISFGSTNNRTWFETPVPIYVLAVAITLGFWGGDIFDRNFGPNKKTQRIRRAH